MPSSFQQQLQNKKPYLIGVFIALVATLLFAVFFAIPRAAGLTLPFRWGYIPLGQKRFAMEQYLGRTTAVDSVTPGTYREQRIAYRKNGEYTLNLYYSATDTTVTGYSIYFTYRMGFFHKQYLLKEEKK